MKPILPLVTLLILTVQLYSQELEFEVMAGPTISRSRGNEYYNKEAKFKAGFFGGLGVSVRFDEKSSFNTRILYERKGFRMSRTASDFQCQNCDPIIFKYTLLEHQNYLVLPLLYGRTFGGDGVTFKLEGGPYVGYLLSRKSISTFGNDSTTVSKSTSYFTKFDAGLSVGMSILIPLNDKMKLRIGNINNVGLVNTSKSSFFDERTLSLQFVTGLVFGR
jgi:hypothetical protein